MFSSLFSSPFPCSSVNCYLASHRSTIHGACWPLCLFLPPAPNTDLWWRGSLSNHFSGVSLAETTPLQGQFPTPHASKFSNVH